MLNDLNIMWMYPLMNAIKVGGFPPDKIKYTIGNELFDWYYFLTDGIYPHDYKIYVQTLPFLEEGKDKLLC